LCLGPSSIREIRCLSCPGPMSVAVSVYLGPSSSGAMPVPSLASSGIPLTYAARFLHDTSRSISRDASSASLDPLLSHPEPQTPMEWPQTIQTLTSKSHQSSAFSSPPSDRAGRAHPRTRHKSGWARILSGPESGLDLGRGIRGRSRGVGSIGQQRQGPAGVDREPSEDAMRCRSQ
jgi:hypothetical protein